MSRLRGSIEEIHLPLLVRWLSGQSKTGRLSIRCGVLAGEMFLEHGGLVVASFDSEHGLDALDAMALVFSKGEFEFVEGRAPNKRHVEIARDELDLHLDRLATERDRLATVIPSLAAIPRILGTSESGGAPGDGAADRATIRTLLAVDGQRTVAEIGAEGGLARTVRNLAALVDLGLIEIPVPAAGLSEPHSARSESPVSTSASVSKRPRASDSTKIAANGDGDDPRSRSHALSHRAVIPDSVEPVESDTVDSPEGTRQIASPALCSQPNGTSRSAPLVLTTDHEGRVGRPSAVVNPVSRYGCESAAEPTAPTSSGNGSSLLPNLPMGTDVRGIGDHVDSRIGTVELPLPESRKVPNEATRVAEQRRADRLGLWRVAGELVHASMLALLVFLAVRSVVQNFRVEGTSMEPSLQAGQILLVNKAAYFHTDGTLIEGLLPSAEQGSVEYPFGGPSRGDVAVFRAPVERNTDYIKRVIGLPGDAVVIRSGDVFVNGRRLSEPYVQFPFPPTYDYPEDGEPVIVPDGNYFVLGDNRLSSFDSHLGWFVPVENFAGRAWISYWPSNMWGLVEHPPITEPIPSDMAQRPQLPPPAAVSTSVALATAIAPPVATPSSQSTQTPGLTLPTEAVGSRESSEPGLSLMLSPVPPLASPRYYHTATLLDSGEVLVAGGKEQDRSLASAERYDPASNRWVPAGTLATQRSEHTATRLTSGQVLVVGGRSSSTTILNTAELYDPVMNSWAPAGTLATARTQHTAELLENGKVLVAGGYGTDSFLATAELYDPASGRWTSTSATAVVHSGHTSTRLLGGQVLVVGGFGTRSQAESERYDPGTNNWVTVRSLEGGRLSHSATLLPDGKLFVIGGLSSMAGGTYLDTAELYDPRADRWTIAASMTARRGGHSATLLPDGQVLLIGGKDGDHLIAGVDRYDLAANVWAPAGRLATARWLHTATLLPGGRVLAVGGRTEIGEALASAEQYDSTTNSWVAAR